MNIFEIFSYGKGRINEENMSSVLGFLLDPTAPHGFGREALITFLEPIENYIREKLIDTGKLKPLANQKDSLRILANRAQRIDIEFERKCFIEDSKSEKNFRLLDLVISFYNDELKPNLIIAIENKIRPDAATDTNQLTEEYRSLKSETEDTPIIFIYITPEILLPPSGDLLWNNFSTNFPDWHESYKHDLYHTYAWRKKSTDTTPEHLNAISTTTIQEFATNLLNKEYEAKINPASGHSTLLLKSMIRFIEQNFKREEFESSKEYIETDYSTRILNDLNEFWEAIGNANTKSFAKKIKSSFIDTYLQEINNRNLHLKEYATRNRYAFFVRPNDEEPTKSSRGRILTIRSDGRTRLIKNPSVEIYSNCTDDFEYGINTNEWNIERHEKGLSMIIKLPADGKISNKLNEFLETLAKNSLEAALSEI